MRKHPFEPLISNQTKKIIVGTLPPEGARFYFSNSSNTRLWDILKALKDDSSTVGKGGNDLSNNEKIEILNILKIGISDIIYGYYRDDYRSTEDKHIDPHEYNDLLGLAVNNNIKELLFVYQSAYKWFIHSLEKVRPVRLVRLQSRYNIGSQEPIVFEGETIKCTLLPSPLNRGSKGQTLSFKLEFYRKHILGDKDTSFL
jgi:G:T/U-mismatch repair DNA glycosylase